MLYSRRDDAYDNFTYNEYKTLTNNKNMNLWSYSFKRFTLRRKEFFIRSVFVKSPYQAYVCNTSVAVYTVSAHLGIVFFEIVSIRTIVRIPNNSCTAYSNFSRLIDCEIQFMLIHEFYESADMLLFKFKQILV